MKSIFVASCFFKIVTKYISLPYFIFNISILRARYGFDSLKYIPVLLLKRHCLEITNSNSISWSTMSFIIIIISFSIIVVSIMNFSHLCTSFSFSNYLLCVLLSLSSQKLQKTMITNSSVCIVHTYIKISMPCSIAIHNRVWHKNYIFAHMLFTSFPILISRIDSPHYAIMSSPLVILSHLLLFCVPQLSVT